jgi:rhodanese-related sulfurtransferase
VTGARSLVRGLGALAAVLGALAAVVGTPARAGRAVGATGARAPSGSRDAAAEAGVERISALQLAEWIRDARPGLRVLDVRDSASFEARHVPSAESVDLLEMSAILPRPHETVVVYSDDDLRDAQATAWLSAMGHRRVHVVAGGMTAWMTEVMDPVVTGDSGATVAAISRYFGGVPRGARRGGTTQVRGATDEFGFAPRRGC